MNTTLKKILSHAFLMFIGLFILSPVIWAVLASFTESTQTHNKGARNTIAPAKANTPALNEDAFR